MRLRLLYISLLSLVVAGCSVLPESEQAGRLSSYSDSTIRFSLEQYYSDWKGVPYQLGGNSRRGVDCSGFIYGAYRSLFGLNLPRTTEQLARLNIEVREPDLRPGDIVMFKTGWRDRHAGIYVGNDQFIHASTSKGVIKSSLNNRYWKGKYWKSVRP